MGEVSVSNVSPLIFLSRGRHLDLLHHFAERVLIPEAVAVEIRKKGASDVTAKALESAPWLEIVETPPIPGVIIEWGLGPGESAVVRSAFPAE